MKANLNELLLVERAGHKVKLRFCFGDHFVKTPWVDPQAAPRLVCVNLSNKISQLVKQRKYQVSHGMAAAPPGYFKAVQMIEYRLASRKMWNCLQIRPILKAMLPDLRIIAPTRGKFEPIWSEFLASLEVFAQEEDIKEKIQKVIYGHG